MATLQLSDLGRRSRTSRSNALRQPKLSPDRPARTAASAEEKAARAAARQLRLTRHLNVPLLRLIQEAILESPQQFSMKSWHHGDVYPGALDKVSGTACIGGWAVVLGMRLRLSAITGQVLGISGRARYILGLSERQSIALFLEWPQEFQGHYLPDPKTYADYIHNARIAAARIEHMIQTGE